MQSKTITDIQTMQISGVLIWSNYSEDPLMTRVHYVQFLNASAPSLSLGRKLVCMFSDTKYSMIKEDIIGKSPLKSDF